MAGLLNRVLGMYVRNFDPKQLTVGIWSGEVKLRNLELKKEALDQLHLPLNVVEGHLGELTLSIPFRNLRGQPVKVNIENVFLLAAPREDANYDAEEEERREHAVKMEKLESAELLKERNTEGMSKEEQQKQQSFTASLTTAIIDNLQVAVKNIHVRYEDSLSDPGHPFAAGLTLKEFSAISTDEHWKPTFIQGDSSSTHKLAKLSALGAYWDTDTQLLGTGTGAETGQEPLDRDELVLKFKDLIVHDDTETVAKHQFILKPVTGQAGIEMDKTGKVDVPKMKTRLFFDELGFVLDEDQYRDALMLVDLFHYFMRHQEYKKHQPKVKPKEDPIAWVRFAGKAVLDRIHDRNRKWSWEYFKERRDDRKRYIELFKKKKKEEKLSAAEISVLDRLERKLNYEDLRFWRSLARNQLRKENVGVKKAPEKQSWSSWVWGSAKAKEQQPEEETQMSEEDRQKLYNAIDFDEKKAITESVDLPKDSVKMQMHMNLQTGSFTLKRDPHGKSAEILKLLFDSFNIGFLQRPESFLAKLSLEGMRLYDGTTPGSLFPQMVKVKDTSSIPDHERVKELTDESAKELMSLKDEELAKRFDNTFFSLALEKNPLDGSADTALNMKLKGMEVVYNPSFVVQVAKFFKPPERHMESISALMETASSTVEDIRKQTRAGLEFALEEHKSINAHLDLQAPLFIVPDSVVQKSSLCLILDAGHISVTSELADKDTIKDIQSKQKQQYTEADWKHLESLMYDKFLLKLDSTQVLIGPSIDETRAQLDSSHGERSLHLIDRINLDFAVETCIVPKGTELTKFRVTGNLPVLHASISDSKYKNLMRLLEVAIPKFDDQGDVKQDEVQAATKSDLRPATATGEAPDIPTRNRSKSFQFSAQQYELVLEEEEEEFKQADFHQTKTGEQAPGVSVHQRNFEFKFVVDKLQGSLFRSDPEGKKPDALLAELVAEHFSLNFYQRPFDMGAEVTLRSLALEDHVEQDPLSEFRNIISSEETDSSQQDLFAVVFRKINPDSPEFMSVYEGIATNLDVSVSTINLIVTRRTLLTLLDFVLVTFTSPGSGNGDEERPSSSDSKALEKQESKESSEGNGGDRIRIKAELKRVAIILNNDGIRLATLSLNTASVAMTLSGKSMRVAAKLGNLSLLDDVNQGVPADSSLRQLVTIQSEELADFTYETFDENSDTYPGHDSSIHLRSGSIRINFVTEPFRKIMDFAVKFGKMQAIFNAARQAAANQANQIQERANKIHFDILVRTPIVVFPRMVTANVKAERDLLTAYLGEIYASNKFVPVDDTKKSDTANELSAGIRNVRLTSLLHYPEDKSEELELIDKVDLGFDVTYVEHKAGLKRPDLEVRGSLSDTNLRISAQQMKLALELSRSIPAAFATESDETLQQDVEHEIPSATTESAKEVTPTRPSESSESSKDPARLAPELGTDSEKWTKVDLVFKAGTIGLELLQSQENEPVGKLEDSGLSKFSLNETNVKLRMLSDESLETELLIKSFTIMDTRQRETNKFRKIMSLVNNDITQQFMANVSISGGKDRNMLVILSVDSPRVIVSLDYVFAVQNFLNIGLASDEPLTVDQADADEEATADGSESELTENSTGASKRNTPAASSESKVTEEEASMSMSFRVNVVEAQLILLANPTITSSEAVVLGVKQAIVAKQHATTLQIEKVGMFLCRMDRFDTSRLRILDDFSVATSLDVRSQGEESSMTNIHVDIEPLVLRLSLRDIQLVMQIVTKASELQAQDQGPGTDSTPDRIKEIKGSSTTARSRRRTSTAAKQTTKSIQTAPAPAADTGPKSTGSTILKREEMSMHMGGMRLVLIGNQQELPFLDWSIKEFDVNVRDWSGAMTADTSIDTFFNIYNFSKSAWEPLMEPWTIGFHMSREGTPQRLSIDVFSRKPLELTITTATIALASKTFETLSSDEDVLSKPRGSDAPYRIRNYTGFTANVWAHSTGSGEGAAATLQDGQEEPWRFEDPTTTRETLAPEGATGVVGLRLDGSGFDSIDRIPVSREGEVLYNLTPKKDGIQHRLLIEVKLGDNIKYITIRSPLLVENNTQIPIELGIYSPEQGHIHKLDPIAPGQGRPAPVGNAAFIDALVVRPGQGFGYTWSDERLFWKDLLKRPTQTIKCRGEEKDAPIFYFQMNAVYDKNNPLTRGYPFMRIRISAPIELQNLLPYDFKYRIYDKNTKKDWTNFLRKGGVSPVHVVNLTHLLLLSVDLQDTPFKQSEFAIINSPDRDFTREKAVTVKDSKDLPLRLKLHYFNCPDTGGAFKVTVYSPYVILNRTGLELGIRSKGFMSGAKAAAGQGVLTNEESRALPLMFSYGTDDQSNRATLKVGDSSWSKPQSFEAIGSNFDVAMPAPQGRSEMRVGVSVDQGEGKVSCSRLMLRLMKLTHSSTICPML